MLAIKKLFHSEMAAVPIQSEAIEKLKGSGVSSFSVH